MAYCTHEQPHQKRRPSPTPALAERFQGLLEPQRAARGCGYCPGTGDGGMSRARLPRLSGRPSAYDVGYGKPPTASRFKKGQSGNPRLRRLKATDPDATVHIFAACPNSVLFFLGQQESSPFLVETLYGS